MRGHHLRILEQAAILHIGCDARCSKRMATGGHVEPCVLCAAANHAEYVNPAKATRCQVSGAAPRGASAATEMKVEDYYRQGKRWWVRLHEKGGKRHEMPAHHNLEEYLDAYLRAAVIKSEKKSPLFRADDRFNVDAVKQLACFLRG